MDLVMRDLARVRELVRECSALPHPDADPEAWTAFVLEDASRWRRVVGMTYFTDSVCDRDPVADAPVPERPFGCDRCPAAFGTEKELAQHRRRKHDVRCPQRFFAPASATCPVCGTLFQQRLRLLSHLCDKRRPKCWQAILAAPDVHKPLAAQTVKELDMQDRLLRRAAQRAGHSHHLARGVAVRPGGAQTGRACL